MRKGGAKMASPMAVAVMTKKVLELAADKRVRTLLVSIVGVIMMILIPLLAVVSTKYKERSGKQWRVLWQLL